MPSITNFAGSVPQHYDTYLGPVLFEPYAIDLVDRMESNYQSILELACGTGRVSRHLVHKLAANGRLLATDLNADMLKIARQAISDPRVEWLVADAQALPFDDARFDLVACQYGIMFFQDKSKALGEIFRVLKPGRRVLFNTWSSLSHNALCQLTVQALQELFPEDPPSFFERGPYSFYDTDLIRRLLEDAGFTEISIEKASRDSVAPSVDEAVTGILDGTPVSAFLQENSAQAPAVRQRLRELLVTQYGETNLRMPMEAFVCSAVKS